MGGLELGASPTPTVAVQVRGEGIAELFDLSDKLGDAVTAQVHDLRVSEVRPGCAACDSKALARVQAPRADRPRVVGAAHCA